MSEAIDALLENAGLSRVASQLKDLALPSIRLMRRGIQEDLLSLGTSKLGGLPDLVQDISWPTWKGMPLAFIAQINLTELPVLHERNSLPASGLLSFFYYTDQTAVAGFDPASRGGWRVLYYEGEISHLQRRPLPTSLLEAVPPMQYGHFPACALTFSVEITFPPATSLPVGLLNLSQQEYDAYWDILSPLFRDDNKPRHRLLGHPDVLQDDMQMESQLVSHGLYLGDGFPKDRTRVEQLLSGAQDWQLLFQLDTDPEAEMDWGIYGRCYYWIQTQALQKRDFENVWSIIQWA